MDVDFDADSLSVDEEEQSSAPPLKKKKTDGRWRGAAIYKTKFDHSWQKTNWRFCLLLFKGDSHSCHCSVCNKCGHHTVIYHLPPVKPLGGVVYCPKQQIYSER